MFTVHRFSSRIRLEVRKSIAFDAIRVNTVRWLIVMPVIGNQRPVGRPRYKRAPIIDCDARLVTGRPNVRSLLNGMKIIELPPMLDLLGGLL